jgi:hypothetical protein
MRSQLREPIRRAVRTVRGCDGRLAGATTMSFGCGLPVGFDFLDSGEGVAAPQQQFTLRLR